MEKKYTIEEFVEMFNDNSLNELWTRYVLDVKQWTPGDRLRKRTKEELKIVKQTTKEA